MSNNRFYHDEHIFLDLEKVLMIARDEERQTKNVVIYFKDAGTAFFFHPSVGDLIAAMVAYTSLPEPAPAAPTTEDPRLSKLRDIPYLSTRQKERMETILSATGYKSALVPNPLKPGVVAAPEEKLSSVKESSGAEFMRPVLVGHGPETRSINIIAPEEWRYCSISSDSNSDSGEDPLN